MFKNLVKQFLVVTLASSTFTCGYVHAMPQKSSQETIIILSNKSQFYTLQELLDYLSKYSTPRSIKAHKMLVDYVKTLKKDKIEDLFNRLNNESTLKMALRLVYAQKHKENLDHLDCLDFIQNINNWVNGCWAQGTTLLFSQAYLQFTLPLLESIINDHVTSLTLTWNELTSLPDSIGNLVNMKELNLSNNLLTIFPYSIVSLVNLKKLYLIDNQLTSLPDSIGNLVNLKDLWLARNKLTSLPDSIGNLVNLEELCASSNKLTSLPDSIGNLANLRQLHLSQNQLNSLPDSFDNLKKLTMLTLSNNNLTL